MHSSKSYIHPTLIYPPQAFFQPAATVRLHLGVLVQHSPLSSAQIGKNHYASNNRRTAAEVTSTATRIKIKLPLNLRFLPKCVVDVWHISTPRSGSAACFSATPGVGFASLAHLPGAFPACTPQTCSRRTSAPVGSSRAPMRTCFCVCSGQPLLLSHTRQNVRHWWNCPYFE